MEDDAAWWEKSGSNGPVADNPLKGCVGDWIGTYLSFTIDLYLPGSI